MQNIWVLKDPRIGTYKQALALADAIKMDYKIIDVHYNKLAKIPNFMLGATKYTVTKETRAQISKPFPKLVISAGRKTLPLAKYIKKISNAKIIQIMWPGYYDQAVDAFIVPQHDNINKKHANIITTIGSLNNIDLKELYNDYENNKHLLRLTSGLTIGLLIGGDHHGIKFNLDYAEKLIQQVNFLATKYNANIIYSVSRRTPEKIQEYIKNVIKAEAVDVDLIKDKAYHTLLGASDYIIVTGDSVSMCSEVANLGKKMYIYAPNGFCTAKQNFFHKQLINNNIAKYLTDYLEHWSYQPLCEMNNIIKKLEKLDILKF